MALIAAVVFFVFRKRQSSRRVPEANITYRNTATIIEDKKQPEVSGKPISGFPTHEVHGQGVAFEVSGQPDRVHEMHG